MKYIITDADDNKLEDYEENDNNIIHFSVLDLEGNQMPSDKFKVCINLSQDGILAFGKELIRLYHQSPKIGKHFHFEKIQKNTAVMTLGVYLHPSSCEPIVCVDNFETVDEIQENI